MSNSLDFQYHHEIFKNKLEINPSSPTDPIIAFPLPMINIDSSANSDAEGRILGTTYRIGLEGYIIAASTGLCTKELIAASVRLEEFFKDSNKQGGVFKVGQVNSAQMNDVNLSISGVVFKDIRLDRSENNWTRYIPYSLSLEGFHAGSGRYAGYSIVSAEDSWSIEQLDNISYIDLETPTTYKDYKAGGQIDTSKSPSENDLSIKSSMFKTQNVLQYRVTHRIGATGRGINSQDVNNPSHRDNINYSYVEASRWVHSRLHAATNKPSSNIGNDQQNIAITGLVIDAKHSAPPSLISELSLYNHIRTIDSNVSQGSYSLTDTWLALSSGIDFTEESTWEIITDDKFVKTVNLNGTVYGLEKVKESGYSSLNEHAFTGLLPKQYIDNREIVNSKIEAAISGYVNKIKPFLYKRASIALSSIPGGAKGTDTQGQVSTTNTFIGSSNNAPLNVTPVNYTESINANAGTIAYNVSYTNKLGSFLSGVLSSTMSITDTGGVDQVAETFVLGRPLGPLLHRVGKTKTERRINVEVVYPAPSSYIEAHPNSPKCPIHESNAQYKELKTFVESFRPIAPEVFATLVPTSAYSVSQHGVVFKTNESKTWNPFEGRYAWDVTWVYTTGVCIY